MQKRRTKYITRKLAKALRILNKQPNEVRHAEAYQQMDFDGWWWDVNRQVWTKKGKAKSVND